jgi:hypothetical protein
MKSFSLAFLLAITPLLFSLSLADENLKARVFMQKVDSSTATIIVGIYFDNCRFDKGAGFYATDFRGVASFSHAIFVDTLELSNAHFNKLVYFDNGIFLKMVAADSADFADSTFFSDAQFENRTTFNGAVFRQRVEFWSAVFHKNVRFWGSRFNGNAVFKEAVFDSTADFWSAQFSDSASFENAIFRDYASFQSARLPRYLDFSGVRHIEKELDFTDCRPPTPEERCHIRLTNTDISKIRLRYLNVFTLDPDTSTTYEQQGSVYENLLSKLQQDGFSESYKELDIEFKRFQYSHSHGFFTAFLSIADNWWWNYGYNKERILGWTLGIFLLFLVVTGFKLDHLVNDVYALDFLQERYRLASTANRPRSGKVLYSLMYTATIFFGFTLDTNGLKPPTIWTIYIFVVYTIGLVCMGFVVNFIFK